MGVTMRDHRDVSFLEPDWFEFKIISEKRYPARSAGNDMVLDCMLSAGRDLIGNLRRRWCFRDPRRFGGDVKKTDPDKCTAERTSDSASVFISSILEESGICAQGGLDAEASLSDGRARTIANLDARAREPAVQSFSSGGD